MMKNSNLIGSVYLILYKYSVDTKLDMMPDKSSSMFMVSCDGIMIETTITHEASIVEEWIKFVSSTYTGNPKVVGLDTEWTRAQNKMKVAILQLCVENKCLIVQLFLMNNNIPQSLKSFFVDSDFKFVGVGVINDLNMLKSDYGLESNKGIDISHLAKQIWPDRISSMGLKYLAKELVGLDMKKSKEVCTSEWKTKDLTRDQIEYASIDAYASFKIGKMILSEDIMKYHDS
ncbi:Werner Syndrome-like exonuclease isoform X2 [Cajanus cajan]|uniref:Werner Syndrome-like exonuclease isoform X2 n=1 Tax=Cajanus cajan TaxID=3821 RepID=UPI0010FB3470|nr:Werner Syndrome-like exonuclease isoform X2 [Cajanus cajan]